MKNNLLLLCSSYTFSILIITLSVSLLLSHTSTEVLAQQKQQQQDNVTDSKVVDFLAIQHTQSGSISENNATSYLLKLNNASNETIMFSDRPERIVESISTSDFVGNWNIGQDSFAADPPNAVLVSDDIQTMDLDVSILELYDPIYNSTNNSLIYTITTTNNTALELTEKLGQAVLVIDSPPCNPTDDSTNGLSLNDCGY
jgi:hypothetical protein